MAQSNKKYNLNEIVEEIEREIDADEFGEQVALAVRRQHTDNSFIKYEKIIEFAPLLSRRIAEQNKALILDAHGSAEFQYTIGMVNPTDPRATNAVSRALRVFSVGAIDYVSLSPSEFPQLLSIAYGERKLAETTKKSGKEFRSNKQTYDWGELVSEGVVKPPEIVINVTSSNEIDNLDGKRLDLTDTDWYYSILRQVDDGSFNFYSLKTLQIVGFILMDFNIFGGNDFHLQCNGKTGCIRYRRQNIMTMRWENIPYDIYNKIANNLIGLAGRDQSRLSREPVESVLKARIPAASGEGFEDIQYRYESIHTSPFPTVNLRAQSSLISDINKVGLLDFQIDALRRSLAADNGIIIVTGATGSGKSVTLNSMFKILEDELIWNIYEFGMPIEQESAGRNQVSLRDYADEEIKRKYLQECFKAVLRLDPDVVGFTEMRERWEADIILDASRTGHLVFTTMHAGSVEESLTRLMSLGVEIGELSQNLLCIHSQRLVNKLCAVCRQKDEVFSILAGQDIFKESGGYLPSGKPCLHCNRGFHGRTAVSETLLINSEVSKWIRERRHPADIIKLASEAGYLVLMKRVALRKMLDGFTSESEIRSFAELGDTFGANSNGFSDGFSEQNGGVETEVEPEDVIDADYVEVETN